MTPDDHLNRSLGSPLSLHQRQVDPLDTPTQAFGFCHRHSELVRLIRYALRKQIVGRVELTL